jgi:hypothetical protein
VVDRTDDHRRAQAAAELTAQTTKLADSEPQLDALAQTRDNAAAAHEGAEDAARELDVQLRGLKAARASAQEDRDDATADLAAHDTQVSETQSALGVAERDVVSASQNWPNGEEAGRERCAEDPRDGGRLRNVANETLHESLVAVGLPHGAEDDAPSDELIAALGRRRADENTPFPVVAGPLRAYLNERSDHDTVLRERIEAERPQTREALDEADSECSEMRASLDRIQEAIQRQVEGTINGISEQFNELDREGGGYGACLRLDMQPPVDASDTWRWSVTPMWKRAPRGPMVAYNAPTNSAQDKIYTVNLVLAALLGVGNSEGKVLILDELGNSLDFEHRRSVLSAIAQTAQTAPSQCSAPAKTTSLATPRTSPTRSCSSSTPPTATSSTGPCGCSASTQSASASSGPTTRCYEAGRLSRPTTTRSTAACVVVDMGGVGSGGR